MTLSEFDTAVEAAMASGDPTALEKLLAVAERNAAATQIRCADHKRYRGKNYPRGGCRTCWKIYAAMHTEPPTTYERMVGRTMRKGQVSR